LGSHEPQDWKVSELTQLGLASRRTNPDPTRNAEGLLGAFDAHYLTAIEETSVPASSGRRCRGGHLLRAAAPAGAMKTGRTPLARLRGADVDRPSPADGPPR